MHSRTVTWGATAVAVVLLLTVVVSFLPTRRIARVKPTDALRGRVF